MGKSFPMITICILVVVAAAATTYFATLSMAEISSSCQLPADLINKLQTEPAVIESASIDYGNIIHERPGAVLYPLSMEDVRKLAKASYECASPFGISARGNGHSVSGQDMAGNGVVVSMQHLRETINEFDDNKNVKVVQLKKDGKNKWYADVGGEELWIGVLNATVSEGLTPVVWTDFLELSVGGTLSNAGISGQTFRHGPQISNVYELDVITGKGELMTCSRKSNPELFYAVLGGLGQFGIIARARIALEPAPSKVMWIRALYTNFSSFTRDEEKIISKINEESDHMNAVNYMEGALILDNGTPTAWTWITSFFPPNDLPKIMSLVKQYGIIYVLEAAINLKDGDNTASKELPKVFEDFGYVPGFVAQKVVSYVEFLTRVQIGDMNPQTSHPWLNLFIPRSRIDDFNSGVLREIVLKRNITTGPLLFYPMNKNQWDGSMSAVIPDEDVFYTAAFLHASGSSEWQVYEDQNEAILQFCSKAGIQVKQYLPNYKTREEWNNHFGLQWATFQRRKALFDPKMILSPGQRIFNHK